MIRIKEIKVASKQLLHVPNVFNLITEIESNWNLNLQPDLYHGHVDHSIFLDLILIAIFCIVDKVTIMEKVY